jgi:hypothetical protein
MTVVGCKVEARLTPSVERIPQSLEKSFLRGRSSRTKDAAEASQHHSRYFHFKAAGVGVLLEVSVNNRRDDRDN